AFTFLFTSVATGLAAAFLVLLLRPDLVGYESTPVPAAAQPVLLERSGGPVSYADAVQRAAPSVVNVFASKITRQANHPLFDEPLFKRFFGDQVSKPRYKRENSLGSGVIVDADGHIVTNHHVIADADSIRVQLADGRVADAKIVGRDPDTDLALLRIGLERLPVMPLGRSDQLQVGDVVLTIGNPIGLSQTVTQGIVSATGRSLPNEVYVPFIQTDAAVNPGNSGGPLFNAQGEVIGVNSQILSRTGGYIGLSFAIPIRTAMQIAQQLKSKGFVERGWLGVLIQPVTRELAENFDLDRPVGALVAQVTPDSPAEAAGIEVGDVILGFEGQNVEESQQLPAMVAATAPGSEVKLQILRNGKRRTLDLTIGTLPEERSASNGNRSIQRDTNDRLGVRVADLSDDEREALGVSEGGVVVTDVGRGAAGQAGIRSGDVITQVNRRTVEGVESFNDLVENVDDDESILLLVRRGEGALFIVIDPTE
ncbi:MAG: DegQ family serine endoprotease, partial [Xanthomonadales bacterium]|nr:DegQ family serine endoprotease [Xanthomonadales bacterium]